MIVALEEPEAGVDYRKNHASDSWKYANQSGSPIYRTDLKYQIPHGNSKKTHGKMSRVVQFPLKLAWASTGHKVQGVTVKKGTLLVVHGHKKIPNGMYYLMLSRAQEMEQVYLENFTGVIKADPLSLEENRKLVDRSIVQSYRENQFCVFMVNLPWTFSLENKIKFLQDDTYAPRADHICTVETCLGPNEDLNLNFPERLVFCLYP